MNDLGYDTNERTGKAREISKCYMRMEVPLDQLIWTRGQEDWAEDRRRLDRVSAAIVHVPTISTQALQPDLPPQKPSVVLVSSPKGIAYAKANHALWAWVNGARFYCFGTSTFAALRSALRGTNITAEQVCARDGRGFAEAIASHLKSEDHVAVLRARETAYDIADELHRRGFDAQGITVYETLAAVAMSPDVIKKAQSTWQGVVCFASPSAVRAFAEAFLKDEEGDRLRQSLVAVAIGETTAQEARPCFARVELAPAQSVEALIEAALLHLRSDTRR